MEESWQIEIEASPEKLFDFLTDMEKLKIWLQSHGMARYQFPPGKSLQVGNIITIKPKRSLWKFVAKTIVILENKEVKHQFIEGTIKGTETWIIKSQGDNSCLIHTLDYEVPRLVNRLFWRLIGQKLHSKGKKAQLNTIKKLTEER